MLSFYLNLINVFINILLMYSAFKKSELIKFVYYVVLLFIVSFQAVNISYNLIANKGTVLYLTNFINAPGHLLATFFLTYTLIYFVYYDLFRVKKVRSKLRSVTTFENKKRTSNVRAFNFIITFIVFGGIISLIAMKGLSNIIDESRPGSSGATFFLILIGMGIYPVLFKIANSQKISFLDIFILVVSLLFCVQFSRILVMFNVINIIFAFCYKGLLLKKVTLKKYTKQIFLGGIILICIFLFIGAFKNLKNFEETSNLSFIDSIKYAFTDPEKGLLSFDLIYRISIEGMSGLSGVLSNFLSDYTLHADFGLSLIAAILNLIPSIIRQPVAGIQSDLSELYWYHGSILAGGLENFFVHFSFVGLIFYPIILSKVMDYLHNKLLRTNMQSSNFDYNFLRLIILATFCLLLIRGNTSALIFYIICNLFTLKMASFFRKLRFN